MAALNWRQSVGGSAVELAISEPARRHLLGLGTSTLQESPTASVKNPPPLGLEPSALGQESSTALRQEPSTTLGQETSTPQSTQTHPHGHQFGQVDVA
jgi:hypothetical protein